MTKGTSGSKIYDDIIFDWRGPTPIKLSVGLLGQRNNYVRLRQPNDICLKKYSKNTDVALVITALAA